MNSKHTLSTTDARKNLFRITKEVQTPGIHYTLTENGKPKAVLLSAEEFESWQETVALAWEEPDLAQDIKNLEADIKAGKAITYSTFEEVLEEQGFIIADKGAGRYDVQDKVSSQSQKSSKQPTKKRTKKD